MYSGKNVIRIHVSFTDNESTLHNTVLRQQNKRRFMPIGFETV